MLSAGFKSAGNKVIPLLPSNKEEKKREKKRSRGKRDQWLEEWMLKSSGLRIRVFFEIFKAENK